MIMMTGIQNGYTVKPFVKSIESLVQFVEISHNLTTEKLAKFYENTHKKVAACLSHEKDGVDCPLAQCYKKGQRQLSAIAFLKIANQENPKTVEAVDKIYQHIKAEFPAVLEGSELQSYYAVTRSRVEAASFLQLLQTLKPETMDQVKEIYEKTNSESLPTGYKPSDLTLAWMSIKDVFRDLQEIAALERQTVGESFGRYVPYTIAPQTEATLIAKAVKSVREAANLSFPRIDIREGMIPFESTEECRQDREQATEAAVASMKSFDQEERIGLAREELTLLGLIETTPPSKNIPDMILDDLLGELVLELNAMDEAKNARAERQANEGAT